MQTDGTQSAKLGLASTALCTCKTAGTGAGTKLKTMSDPKDERDYSKEEQDNHANQLNSNNDAYWDSRGCDGRPDDWDTRDE